MAGIYIHIPYCKKLCYYCDFYHIISSEDNSMFISSLLDEITLRKDYLGTETISTIYIGGGTPSVIKADDLGRLVDHIYKNFKIEDNCEITIELNPDDVSPAYLKRLKLLKFNRISIGIQSWEDSYLKMLNRRHDSLQAEAALKETFNAGFENVSIDLIYGIPGMTLSEWVSCLDFSLAFDIKHLSAYHLTIEKGTVFSKMLEKGLIAEIDEEESMSMFNMLIEKAESAGFIQYEISNLGKPGFFSIHNSNYWKQINYIGFGPSAHSFNGYSRQWNVSEMKTYIKGIKGDKSFFEKEELDSRTRFNEYIMTSLRTMWGIDLEYVEKTFEKEGYDYIVTMAVKFKDYGLMRQEHNKLTLTNQGKMISDNIISEFMMPAND